MDRHLQAAANYGCPGSNDNERILRTAGSEGDHAGDHGDVPQDGCGVRDKELAVAVEYPEAPGGTNQQAGAGKEYANNKDGEFAFFPVETRDDRVDEPRRSEDAEENDHGGAEGEESGDCASGFPGFFLIAAGQQVGIDGNEGSREDTFTEKVLQEVGDAECGFEDVGSIGIAEVMGEDAVADQSGNAAEEDAGGNEKSRALGTGG